MLFNLRRLKTSRVWKVYAFLNEMLDGQEKEIAKDNIEVIAYKGMELDLIVI